MLIVRHRPKTDRSAVVPRIVCSESKAARATIRIVSRAESADAIASLFDSAFSFPTVKAKAGGFAITSEFSSSTDRIGLPNRTKHLEFCSIARNTRIQCAIERCDAAAVPAYVQLKLFGGGTCCGMRR